MKKIGIILKYQFLLFIGNLSNKKNAKKNIGGGLLVLLISLVMISSFTATAVMTTLQFVELSTVLPGAEELAMFSNLIIGMLLVVLFTVLRSVYPPKTKDEETLLSLPITKRDIIIAKSFYNYLFDVVSYAMVLMPSFVVYYILVDKASILVIVWGTIFVLLVALFSSSISYLISLLVSKYLTRFKFFGLIQSLITLLFLGGYLILQYSLPSILENIDGEISDYINQIGLIKLLINWILHNDWLSMLLIIGVCISAFVLALVMRIAHFGKQFKGYQTNVKTLKFKKQKKIISLYLKEIKYYLSTSIYFINTIVGCFFIVGMSVAYRIIGEEQVFTFINALPPILRMEPQILIVIISSCLISTTITTSVSISLEGNNIWILKAHPVNVKDIFNAKILVNVTVCSVACLISSLLFTNYQQPLTFIPYFVIPLLVSLNTGTFGLIINLFFPKLEFDSVEAVCKRSLAVPIAMFGSFLLALIPTFGYFLFGKNWNFSIFCLVNLGVLIMLFVGLYSFLLTKGSKLFKKLT